jgi:hypothetical protein
LDPVFGGSNPPAPTNLQVPPMAGILAPDLKDFPIRGGAEL